MISSKLGVLNVFSAYNIFNVQCVYPGGNPNGLGRSLGRGNSNPLQDSCLKIPQTEEPGSLQSMGHKESDMTTDTHMQNPIGSQGKRVDTLL